MISLSLYAQFETNLMPNRKVIELLLQLKGAKAHDSETGYEYLFKNNRLLFSRTINYCFPIVLGNFCNLIIRKQGIEMHFFPKQVVEILKKWAPPRQVLFKETSFRENYIV